MSSLSELFQFLHAPNPDARELALANLAGHTPKTAAARNIFIPSGATPLWREIQDAKEGSAKNVSEQEKEKVQMLEDLKTLCRDQAVSRPFATVNRQGLDSSSLFHSFPPPDDCT